VFCNYNNVASISLEGLLINGFGSASDTDNGFGSASDTDLIKKILRHTITIAFIISFITPYLYGIHRSPHPTVKGPVMV